MRKNYFAPIYSAVFVFALYAVAIVSVFAQNGRNPDYSPDASLKSNARVNPSTLAMEISVPITSYPGRGGNPTPVTFNYSSKVWQMEKAGVYFSELTGMWSKVKPLYAKRSASGWTSTLGTPILDLNYDYYRGPDQDAEYEGQMWDFAVEYQTPDNYDLYWIKRVRITMPDGTSHELRGSDLPINVGSTNGGVSAPDQTGNYLSVDGSRMRLEIGSSTSTLYMSDGSRYLFGSGTTALATTHYDVHGNKMTYNVTTKVWVDTLGRELENPFHVDLSGWDPPSAGDVTAEFPGFGSDTTDVELSWKLLKPTSGEGALDDPDDDLEYRSDRYCFGSTFTLLTDADNLFGQGATENTRVCDPGSESSHPTFNPAVLTKIEYENGQSYQFKYNTYGEIVRIIYPTGGYEKFAYASVPAIQTSGSSYDQANRGVTDRYVSVKGDGSDEVHWTYAVTRGNWITPAPYKVTITAPDDTYTEQLIHDEPDERTPRFYGFDNAKTGQPYEERTYSSDSTPVLLKRNLMLYESTDIATGVYPTTSGLVASRDTRPTKQVSIVFEPGNSNALATMTETVYDTSGNSDLAYFSSLNPKQTKTYNYVVVSASTAATATVSTAAGWFSSATPASITENDYLYDSNYKARNITGLVTEARVHDPASPTTVKAKKQLTYDETAFDLASSGTMPTAASGSWVDPTGSGVFGSTIGNKRGRVTTTKSYYDIANSYYIETNTFFDQYGNVRKSRDGRDNDSEVQYDDDYAFAYPTSMISAVPDSNGTHGSDAAFITSNVYDYKSGLMTETTDPNGQTTEFEYDDPLFRLSKITAPNGQETINEYGAGTSASTRWQKMKSQIDSTNWKEVLTWADGLGRNILNQSVDNISDDVFVMTCYDNMGRVSKTSNPVKASSAPTCSSSLDWTTPTYDDLGRTLTFTTSDSAVVETAYSLATSGDEYGTVITVEDQAGKLRRSITDAAGRLIRIDEPNGSNALGSIDTPNQDTVYGYDRLGNLASVTQGSQSRSYTYDAVSRLKQAVNPESGTVNYTYDANGNVATKVDARSITTTYTYDTLNRVTLKAYTNEPSGSETEDVSYFYDNVTNAKGKLVKVSSDVSTTEYTSFDILGRVTGHKQTTDSVDYPTEYTYNLSGAMIEETYPSTRKVKNVLDNNGDISIVQSKKTSTAGYWNYANNFTYNVAGNVTSMQLGNGRWESMTFNSRFQPTQIALGTTANATDTLKLEYSYGDWNGSSIDATKNNGNVVKQIITVPTVGSNTGFAATQKYYYDSLNRIDDSTEDISGQTWRQDFSYDRYGNRTLVEANTSTLPKLCNGNTEVCAADHKKLNPSASTSTNRLNTSEDYAFDSAGNVIEDPEDRTFIYDAENKQTKVLDDEDEVIGEYFYDGTGKRVKKYVPNTGETTIFVYDGRGKLIGEYSTVVASIEYAKASYLTNDQLGTPRILTDASGSVIARHDYHPFGEEIATSQRITAFGYGNPNPARQEFTGYERDDEIGLDYAQARYYSSAQGRFTSPDPIMMSPDRLVNPQMINLYVYGLNNPHKYTDPTGEEVLTLGEAALKALRDEIEEAKAKSKADPKNQDLKAQVRMLEDKLAFLVEANKIVGAWLQALQARGGGKGLSLDKLKISTTPGYDLAKSPEELAKKGIKGGFTAEEMAAARDNPVTLGETLDGQIYIFTGSTIYQSQMEDGAPIADSKGKKVGAADTALFGGSFIEHEDTHLNGRAVVNKDQTQSLMKDEHTAYDAQLKMLVNMEPSFKNKTFYQDKVNEATKRRDASPKP